jgi:transcriptional regulator with XRE-family HTH domain
MRGVKGNGNLVRGLARRRRACGLTQHDVARLTGIGLNKLVYIETGRAVPSDDELDRICAVLRKRARQVLELVSA